MSLLASADELRQQGAELAARVSTTPEVVLVTGPTGGGRATLAQAVAQALGARAVALDLLSLDAADAGIHVLLQLGAAIGTEGVRRALAEPALPESRATELAKDLAAGQRVVLMRVPATWPRELGEEGANLPYQLQRVRSVMHALLRVIGLAAVVLVERRDAEAVVKTLFPREREHSRLDLGTPRVARTALRDAARWGTYEPYAAALAKRDFVDRLTPIEARLAVALLALGESPDALESAAPSRPLAAFAKRLRFALEVKKLLPAVERFLVARLPVPKAVALQVARVPNKHEPLITECIGYGGDELRVPDLVRLELTPRRAPVAAHTAWMNQYAALDGATRPPAGPGVVPWLEKIHHAAHAGDAGNAIWEEEEQGLLARDLIWDRARALSRDRQYSDAAALYERCIQKFGPDDYSLHYLGFNVWRAGGAVAEVEAAYRGAVARAKDNAWWNSRLVTFLIEAAKFRAAEEQWASTMSALDPTGERVWESPWLALHVHRHVARSWLHAGEAQRAQAILEGVPSEYLQREPKLQELAEEIADACEAEELGESVYAADVPMAERWLRPRVLFNHLPKGQVLRHWFPGRVVSAAKHGVTIVVASPADRRVVMRNVSAAEWIRWAGWSRPEDALDSFVEVGEYDDGAIRILVAGPRAHERAPATEAPISRW